MVNKNPRAGRLWGFLFRFGKGGLSPRLAAGYCFLSNHLQMKWQTTPAITERVKVMSSSVGHPPPFLAGIGVATQILYHVYSSWTIMFQSDAACFKILRLYSTGPFMRRFYQSHSIKQTASVKLSWLHFGLFVRDIEKSFHHFSIAHALCFFA